MVAQRRLRPLGVVVVAGLGVLAARLFQIQVVEGAVWRAQAQSFLIDSAFVPYHRGEIRDRNQRLLVGDEDVANLEFVYRDFRRGHPLGQAAHARSVILGKPVGLAETAPQLADTCVLLAGLTPAAIDAFARGELPADSAIEPLAPATAEPGVEGRAGRATDLRFYVQKVLGITRSELGKLNRRIEDGGSTLPWVDLLAAHREESRAALLTEVRRRADESLSDLRVLATLLAEGQMLQVRARSELASGADGMGGPVQGAHPGSEPASGAGVDPLEKLLQLLDTRRSDQEDAAATELFRTACGFSPGRLPTEALRDTFDLTFIARPLRWDAARLEQWVETRREVWDHELEEVALPRILANADLGETEAERAQRLLDGLADLWRAGDARRREPLPWTDFDEPCVLHEARSLFRDERGRPTGRASDPVLTFQDEELRDVVDARAEEPWYAVGLLFEMAALRAGLESPVAEELALEWNKLSKSGPGLDEKLALQQLCHAARAFEAAFAGAVLRTLGELRGTGGPLRLAEERLDRALQRERFVLVDVQGRPERIPGSPSYALVHLVARDHERYAGFSVRESTRRVAPLVDAQGVPCASLIIGATRRPFLRDLVAQSEDERRLAELQYRIFRSEEERRELEDLSARLARADEWIGSHGLEAWFDDELRGKFGLYRLKGLDDEVSTGIFGVTRDDAPPILPTVDGLEIVLTIDASLQIAAQDVLAHPVPPATDTDRIWFQNPVGAIVLMTPDGEVLAAASEPTRDGAPDVPGRGRQRSHAFERTLQTPTFNPPGSVFKPFVSAWALDRLHFDPNTHFACTLRDDGKSGAFEDLRCAGHHEDSDLHRALVVSCNAYFAQLGLCFEPAQLVEAARTFGFGEPTGARSPAAPGRRGLQEDWTLSAQKTDAQVLDQLGARASRLRFPNGLDLLEATPMQVARATAGLATGVLPEVRLVRTVGGVPLPRASRPLGLSDESLAFVRQAMRDVVDQPGGSGHGKKLDAQTLGFTLACKTGSADIMKIVDVPDMPVEDRAAGAAGKSRKHTWVAGWFPAEDPVAIVVVYLNNVTETASRTAAHVTAQLLQTQAVRDLVARKGAQ